jgi:hypothetical protein
MKSFFSLTLGFIGLLFLEGFSRLIMAFYHHIEFHFYGVSHLPSASWIPLLFMVILISTWLITMLILTITNTRLLLHSLLFLGMVLVWRGIEIANSYQSEPVWYLITICLLHIIGVILAYFLYRKQQFSA